MSGPECSVTAGQRQAQPLFPGLWELESEGQGSSSQAVPIRMGVGHPQVLPPPPLITGKVQVQWGRQAGRPPGGWRWEWGLSGTR